MEANQKGDVLMQVREIMTPDVICCSPEDGLQQVAQMMLENDCGAIPVVQDESSRKLVGIVTDRDIVCRTVAVGNNPLELTVRDCMTSPCTSVEADADVDVCCRMMEEQKIRRVPVVDEAESCCGMVAQADVALHGDGQETAEVVKEVSQPL
jgi:CBS domain-containing protein